MLTLLCFSILIKLNAQASDRNDDILYWSGNHRLTFNDFKGKPSQNDTTSRKASPEMLTHKLGAIIKSINVHLVTVHNKTTFTINAAMKQNSSWIKDPGDTLELKHEQGHFDICEIYARLLRRDIKNAKSLSEAKEIYEKITIEEEAEQDLYDKDNTYEAGGITIEWSKKIAARLKELDGYKDPVVTLLIDDD